jgi:hypothetical protein
MEESPHSEAYSPSAGQEIPYFLFNPRFPSALQEPATGPHPHKIDNRVER